MFVYSCFSDAAETCDGLVYFLEHAKNQINILPASEAIVLHPDLVLSFLEKCIQ